MTDAARLRFIMSADTSGLRSGCKEGVGSLKDMSSQVGSAMNRMDSGSIDWKGLKKSARSLKFVGREMGGMFKGAIGDVMGVATAGIGMGKMGGALAVGAIGTSLVEQHFAEKLKQQQENQAKDMATVHGAAAHGISATKYRELEGIAAGDDKFLADMADTMKQLADAGPGASAALKSLGKEIEAIPGRLGIRGEHAKVQGEQMATNAADERMKKMGIGRNENWYDNTRSVEGMHALKQHAYDKYLAEGRKENKESGGGKSEAQIQKEAKAKLAKRLSEHGAEAGFDSLAAEWERDAEKETQKAGQRGGILQDPNLKTNKEKLNERLHQISDTKKDIDSDTSLSAAEKASYGEKIGRATEDALQDYRKSQGGPAGMAGAATAGSQEAYSVIAGAQMAAAGAANDTATTNAILSEKFPDLINAVKGLNPNWRRADGPG